MSISVSIIGVGIVGGAIKKSFEEKHITVYTYDKYKNYNTFDECLNTDIMFLCLPTLYNDQIKEYDKTNIYEICNLLSINNYNGLIVIKSTVEPETTENLQESYNNLKFIHNPEFLSADTAFDDFHSQKHIVIGKTSLINDTDLTKLIELYKIHYNAEITFCTSTESESMKIFVNSFYSIKIQFFNELYLLCQKNGSDYDIIKNLMLKNGWINPMHTNVPGNDGQLSYGGLCFPKDTTALLEYMKKHNTLCNVLEATVNERNFMRSK